jgi:hypothetical protein
VVSAASASVLATLRWAPDGPLPRRLEPLPQFSIARPGPTLEHVAASRVRTDPDGAVSVQGAPDPASGECLLLRVGETSAPVAVAPSGPGGRIIDFLTTGDGWTVLELVPGPPDQVVARGLGADGDTLWRTAATAGSADALDQLLVEHAGAALAVALGPPRRLVALGRNGAASVRELAGATAGCHVNGRGQVGFVGYDAATEARSWVTVAIETGERSVLEVDPEAAGGLDLPLGMDGDSRPYGNRYGTLVRIGADGRVDWELPVRDAIVDGDAVWIAHTEPDGLVARQLSAGGEPERLADGAQWRLAGRTAAGFVLHGGGELLTAGERAPAPSDVWSRHFELQTPSAPAVTDAGALDLATRGPDGLHVIRVEPTG